MFTLLAILGLSSLVVIHELGHYLVARAFGMRVLAFSIGFGKAIFEYKPKDSPTTWRIGIIPFLAYVQIAGMNPVEENDPNDKGLYSNKSAFARALAIFAGPFANYAAAVALGLFFASYFGIPHEEPSRPMAVEAVSADSPAARAGVKPGDIIRSANGTTVNTVEDLREITRARAEQPTAYVVERAGKRLEPLTITPEKRGEAVIIGVSSSMTRSFVRQDFGAAAKWAFTIPYALTVETLSQMKKLVQTKSTEGMMDPFTMTGELAKQASKGAPDYVWALIAISTALGLFNLLPFPALDGGRLVFLAYEMLTRRKPNEKFEAIVHAVGLVVLLGFMVLLTAKNFLT